MSDLPAEPRMPGAPHCWRHSRLTEIDDLIAEDDIERAIKRLLDLARDCDTDGTFIDEAVAIADRWHEVEQLDFVRDLVAQNELEMTIEQLRSIVNQTGDRDLRNEALEHAGRLAELRKQERLGHADTEVRRNKLRQDLLAFVDEIARKKVLRNEAGRSMTLRSTDRIQIRDDIRGLARKIEEQATVPKLILPTTAPLGTFLYPPEKAKLHGDSLAFFSCRDLRREFRSRRTTGFRLEGLTFDLRPGEITGLVGENGAGKTTLLNIIGGRLTPTDGILSYPALDRANQASTRRDWDAIRSQIALVPQELSRWYGPLAESLHLAAAAHGIRGRANEEIVTFYLLRLGLDRYRNARWGEIAGGFKMRFELARALVCRPKLLLLDEPLAPLDINTQRIVLQDLRDLASSERFPLPILLSSQHLYEVESIADQMIVVKDGKPLFVGPIHQVGGTDSAKVYEISFAHPVTNLRSLKAQRPDISVQAIGDYFIVRVPDEGSPMHLLAELERLKLRVQSWRDITRSSRRYFVER